MNVRIPGPILGLVAALAAAVVAAVVELGPPTRSTRTATEVITAARGVVTSTVTGTGNVAAGTDVEANFQTSGTLQSIYVKDGDHVVKGQLLATLDPTAAQLTVDQAQENLTSAQDNLANAEAQTASSGSSSSASLNDVQTTTDYVTFHPAQTTTTTTTPTRTAPTQTSTATTPTRTAPTQTSTATTPTRTAPTQTSTATTPATTTPSGTTPTRTSSSATGSSQSGSGQTATTSAATIAANIASARASVDAAEATLKNAETTLHQTHLYAPATGTVVNVAAVSPGDTVTASGSSTSSASSSSSNAASGGSGSSTTAGSLGGSGSSASSSGSSGLVEIVNTRAMTMTVSFSESDIAKIKVGQRANVTLDALSGAELGAHVSAVSALGTSSSGVVSYDATLALDQHDSRVKPGMSASAAVITGQASGVNLPTSAVTSAGSVARVNLLRNGKVVPTSVVVGLVGDSRTQIVSGLRAGDQVQVTTTLPALGSSSASSSGSSGTLGGGGLGGASRVLGGGGGFPGAGARVLGAGGGGFRGGG